MARHHLFEFNDQQWLPAVLRDAQTGYFEAVSHLRTYTTDELRALATADRAGSGGYEWSAEEVRIAAGIRATTLFGRPLPTDGG